MKSKKRKLIRRRRFVERALLLVFLAIAGGASVFLFFLSSKDMKTAQSIFGWSQEIETVLDKIALDLQNAAEIDHPFDGVANQCLFHRMSPGGDLSPMLETETFLFSDNALFHTVKNASGSNVVKSYHGFSNPLISGIQTGQFERLGPRLMKIAMKVSPPGSPDVSKNFERMVFLKNQ